MNPAIFSVKQVGATWTKNQIHTGTTYTFYDICNQGSTWVLTGNIGGAGVIRTTTNPSGAWTSVSYSGSQVHIQGVATNGSRLVLAGRSGGATNTSDYSDNNGATWTSTNPAKNLYGICFGGGQFVAVGHTGAVTSPDGVTWTNRPSLPVADWEDVFHGGGLYVAVGRAGVISTSPDGITWTSRNTGVATDFFSRVRYKAGLWLATGQNTGTGNGIGYISFDGITWTSQTIPSGSGFGQGLAVHKNWFMVGAGSKMWRSISAATGSYASSTSGIPAGCDISGVASDGSSIVSIYNDYSGGGDHGVLVSS